MNYQSRITIGLSRTLFAIALLIVFAVTATTRQAIAAGISCKVQAPNGLRLREGPGATYAVKQVLSNGLTVSASATNRDRKWLYITAASNNGWASASFLVCDDEVDSLPVQAAPPTPTATPVKRGPTPTATPFAVSYTDAPNTDGNPDDLEGRLLIPHNAIVANSTIPIFRDWFVFQLDVRDPDASADNGIRSVEFRIVDDEGNEVYTNIENSAPYCVFPNQTAECNQIWSFAQSGYRWPLPGENTVRPSANPINYNTVYRAYLTASTKDDSKEGNWNFRFRIIPAGVPAYAVYTVPSSNFNRSPDPSFEGEVRIQSDTLADLDINGPVPLFNKRMVFQLVIGNDGKGTDGAGVGSVEFVITEQDSGNVVYQRLERQAPYCLWSNNEAYCDQIWDFAKTNFFWPQANQSPLTAGPFPLQTALEYIVTMDVTDTAGNTVGQWEFSLEAIR